MSLPMRRLLERALTHVSALPAPGAAPRRTPISGWSFWATACSDLAVSDMLYEAFPDAEEGELSRRLADLVRKETCADVARDWGVGAVLRLGEGEAQTGGANKSAILGDICESILGAVFLDAGYARRARLWCGGFFPKKCSIPRGRCAIPRPPCRNGRRRAACRRRPIARSGPLGPRSCAGVHRSRSASTDLSRSWREGSSKRFAEQASAQNFLAREGVVGGDE